MYFEIDIEELIQEKHELEQEFSLLTKEIFALEEHVQGLNSMWEHDNKEEIVLKAEQACREMKKQTEEMKQLLECMDYAVKQYQIMEGRTEQYAKCIAWEF